MTDPRATTCSPVVAVAVRSRSPCPPAPMNSSFWHTPPLQHYGSHPLHHPTAQRDLYSVPCCPDPHLSSAKYHIDDWMHASCSLPDCNPPKSAAGSCTEKCVVVTHVGEKCDGNCDTGSTYPCDMSCDGFDSNWPCNGDDCSMSSFGQHPQTTSYPQHSHYPQDFGHVLHSNPSYPSFYCSCSSGDYSHCSCSAGMNHFFSHHQYPVSHHHQPVHHPVHHHHPPTQQAPPLPPKLPLYQPPAVLQHTVSMTPLIPPQHVPQTPSLNASSSPMFTSQPSAIPQPPLAGFQAAPTSAPVPSLIAQPIQQSQPQKQCMWGECSASFSGTDELLAHLSTMHLLSSDAPSNQAPTTVPASCLWDDCHQISIPSSGLPAEASADAMLSFLQAHLLQDHLGLILAPTAERLTSPITAPAAPPSAGLPSPAPTLSPRATSELSEDDTLSILSPASISLPSLGTTALSEPENHTCHWEACVDVFSSSEALTAHIATAHVGSGKAQYECLWRDCPRNGGQPFASKQKILRHMQSHTGHRPFQCNVCQQHFSEAATLQQHMRRHTREKPYQCDYPGCGKAFAITGALTIHKRIHNGEKPFKCSFCDRAFSESSNLSKHLRTHTGARPYACHEPGCEKRFARPDQVSRHMNVHRKIIKEDL